MLSALPSLPPRYAAPARSFLARLERDFAHIGVDVERVLGDELRALLLVGSYARGEGGCEKRADGEHPHNDYDLIAVVPRVRAQTSAACALLSSSLTSKLGVHVDICPMPASRVSHPPRTLFWLDVANGGARLIVGDRAVMSQIPTMGARDIPLEEAGRLLMNRAVGIALSSLGGPESMSAIRTRHIHKAALACGDAVLLAAGAYQPTLAARARALYRIEGLPHVSLAMTTAYEDALRYRADTYGWTPANEDLSGWTVRMEEWIGKTHLRFEHWRIGTPKSASAFASWEGRMFPELPDVRPLGTWLAAGRAAMDGTSTLFPLLGHPREKLARVAALVAYGDDRRTAATLLGAPLDAAPAEIRTRLLALSSRGS